MSSNEIVIDVQNLSKRYEVYKTPRDRLKQLILPRLHRSFDRAALALGISAHRSPPQYFHEFWALHNVSFQVRRGESLGIIGRNGSGKSTLLQILAGTLAQTSGEMSVNGRIAALLELGSGFSPEFSGRENVYMNGRILGLSQKEIDDRYDQIVAFADIGEFIDQPVKTYSSGMFVRLAFAVQAHIDASIIIIDEALAVGDVFFQQKCYARLDQLRDAGAAILLVSHSMPDIEQYCERAILLDHGLPKFIGSAPEAAKHYYLLHQAQNKAVSTPASKPPSPQNSGQNVNVIQPPPKDAFIDISGKSQVSNGQARCVGVAICNEAGQPCNSFCQGDLAVFYFEFELNEDIGLPICGIVISNERGVIVHGKHSWQFENELPSGLVPGARVQCRQEIVLDLGPGQYVFEVGLAAVSMQNWINRKNISHDESSSCFIRICHLANVGFFAVGLAIRDGVSVLTHHGVANLPSTQKMAVTLPHHDHSQYPTELPRRD